MTLRPWLALLILFTTVTPQAHADDSDTPEEGCDLDEDSFDALFCGGEDCNDSDAGVSPHATEIPGDGLDQDCDGYDAAKVSWTGGGARCGIGASPAPLGLALLALLWRRR